MKIEDQVCGLELARKLKELGVKQESLFYWVERRGFGSEYGSEFGDPELRISPHHVSSLIALEPDRRPDGQFTRTFSAFTTAELGEMLPCSYGEGPIEFYNDFAGPRATSKVAMCMVRVGGEGKFRQITEADARAKMMIYLIEKGLVDV